jgi:hypothetical protein
MVSTKQCGAVITCCRRRRNEMQVVLEQSLLSLATRLFTRCVLFAANSPCFLHSGHSNSI